MKKRVKLDLPDCLKDMDLVQPEMFRDVGGTGKTIASNKLQPSCGELRSPRKFSLKNGQGRARITSL